jgi:hypothetical protein
MEWMNEPDRKEWESQGLPCLILRGPGKSLCGYVGVSEEHPAYGRDYSDRLLYDIDVHGGLTFAGQGDGKHRPAGYWWLGFDCAHFGDAVPAYNIYGTYRDMAYVTRECEGLAKQLAAMVKEATA